MIVVSPNPERVADNHPCVLEIGYRPYAELLRMAEDAAARDLVGLAVLADVAQVLDRTRGVLVSPGIGPTRARRLGFRSAQTVQAALDQALIEQGPGARVAVLRHGGRILPVVRNAGEPPSHGSRRRRCTGA